MTDHPPLPDEFDIPSHRLKSRRQHLMRELATDQRSRGLRATVALHRGVFKRPPRALRGKKKAMVLALISALVAAAIAGAATGLLSVGSVIPLSDKPQSDGLLYTSDRTIVATGTTPVAGRWRMSVADSDQGFCFGIELLDLLHPGATGPDLSQGCGGANTGLQAASVGGGTDLPDTTLVHGPAPEEAAAVRVTAPGGFSQTAKTHEGPTDIRGDFYVIEIPRKGLHDVLVTWLDEDGRAPGPGISVPGTTTYRPNKGPKLPH